MRNFMRSWIYLPHILTHFLDFEWLMWYSSVSWTFHFEPRIILKYCLLWSARLWYPSFTHGLDYLSTLRALGWALVAMREFDRVTLLAQIWSDIPHGQHLLENCIWNLVFTLKKFRYDLPLDFLLISMFDDDLVRF